MAYAFAPRPFTISRQFHMTLRAFRAGYNRWFTDDLRGVSQSMALPETRLPRLLKLSIITLSSATGAVYFMGGAYAGEGTRAHGRAGAAYGL